MAGKKDRIIIELEMQFNRRPTLQITRFFSRFLLGRSTVPVKLLWNENTGMYTALGIWIRRNAAAFIAHQAIREIAIVRKCEFDEALGMFMQQIENIEAEQERMRKEALRKGAADPATIKALPHVEEEE